MHRLRTSLLVAVVALTLAGCTSGVRWLGIRLLYDEVPAAGLRVLSDLPYRDGSADPKHRLDLYLPAGESRPLLVFVHGGGWTAGDKAMKVAGADVYGNIGRFLASQGIGTAVVSYRLQPAVTWREQVADVAAAVAWAHAHAADYGGDPGALFLAGHSAGAQLAAYVALVPAPLGEHGLSPSVLCGVIPVSGAGYDLEDARTYELGADFGFYESRFRAGDADWQRQASAMPYLSPAAPPFLLLHGSREWKSLGYQNQLLDAALRAAGVESRLVVVAGQSHTRMVLALSRKSTKPSTALVDFVRGADCGRAATRGGID